MTNADPKKCICQGIGWYEVFAEGLDIGWLDIREESVVPQDFPKTARVPCPYHSAKPLTRDDRQMLAEAGIC